MSILGNIAPIDYKIYADKVEELSFYPYHNDGNVFSLLYPTLGLAGEFSELCSIHNLDDDEYIDLFIKELGDVCWYAFAFANEIGYDLVTDLLQQTYEVENPFDVLLEKIGSISESVKKVLRDDDKQIGEERLEKFKNDISVVSRCLRTISISTLNEQLEKVLAYNVLKLDSRKARGVLSGSGDNR